MNIAKICTKTSVVQQTVAAGPKPLTVTKAATKAVETVVASEKAVKADVAAEEKKPAVASQSQKFTPRPFFSKWREIWI